MRWFSLGRNLAHVCDYADMVKVAVHIAVKQTLLAPQFLYEGADNALTDWLRKREIPIIRCRTRLFGRLREISQRKQDPQILAIGAGAFLRTELPRIALEMGMEDEYILYTDCDVMFMDQVTEDLEKLSCRYFAVAPEFDSKDYQLMNTGVMLMNLKNLIAVEEKFRKFLVSNLEKLLCWDQSAYQWFYKRPRGNFFFRSGWDRLPIAFNWKPYWGDYSRAKIVHFHGPKPFQRQYLKSAECPEILRDLAKGSYDELCNLWAKMLEETTKTDETI